MARSGRRGGRRRWAPGALPEPSRPAGDGQLNDFYADIELPTPPEPAAPPRDPAAPDASPAEPKAILPAFQPASLHPAIELTLAPEEAGRLARLPLLAACRAGRPKTSVLTVLWHDTADSALAAQGLALCDQRGQWRLEKAHPDAGTPWLPATPPPCLGIAPAPEALKHTFPFQPGALAFALPFPLVPIAAFNGRQRDIPLIWQGTQAQLSIQEGALRGILTDTPVCRVILAGEPRAMAGLAAEMARHLPLQPPLASLAAQARAVAKGVPSPPRRLGAPEIPPQASIDEALTIITAHLADVILYWATQIGSAQTPTPVHQMRVALRRLRSALSVFRRALPESDPWLHDLAAGLKALATLLGTARDWDVFLQTTGAALHQAMPDDRRVAAMMSAAARKRTTAYTALRQCLDGSRPLNEDWKGDLKGNTWRDLAITLALLPTRRPWEGPATAKPASGYAPGALARRLRHLTLNGESLEGLPPEHLHDIRKHAKRLRYAIEFFQPFFPEKAVRKYLGRLETLQEDFGALNDSAVAAALAASLGNPFAAGAVQGYCAARGGRSAKKLQRGWAKFYFETPFWD